MRTSAASFALDTNILVYAEGLGDAAQDLIERLPTRDVLLPAQTLGELARVLQAKTKRSPESIRESLLHWGKSFFVADSSWPALASALDLVAEHSMQVWDALILSVAAEHHCRILYSEDLHDGFTWRGVTVVNPLPKISTHGLG